MTEQKNTGVFSARADKYDIANWKAYATAAGLTVTAMTTEAMKEYMEAHPLKGDQLKMYKLLLKQSKK